MLCAHKNSIAGVSMKQSLTQLALAIVLATQFACTAGGTKSSEQANSSALDLSAILSAEHRAPAHPPRDQWRNPEETLEFFGLQPDQTVMELWPGGGWYTEILAPYLRDNGTYIAAGWDPESEIPFIKNAVAAYQKKLDAHPDVYDKVQQAVLMPPNKLQPVPPGTVDLVLTFRNVHNWMPRNSQAQIMQVMYDSLKPGGVLGVVEHRGDPNVPQDPKAKSGYVNEQYAIELAEAAGFVLDAKSEINANPADTKDHPEGVWTLPPTLRLKDKDKDKYLAIGESDRFTLRFIKPVT